MERLASFIVGHKKLILIVFVVLAVIGAFLMPLVQVNYDMSLYLPEDTATKRNMEIVEHEFGLAGSAQVMLSNVEIVDVLRLKKSIQQVDGVKNVMWLDDLVDIHQPLEYLDPSTVENYYKDKTAFLVLEFEEDDYSSRTYQALDEIRTIVGEEAAIAGSSVINKVMLQTSDSQTLMLTFAVIPLILIVLIFATHSWFEPVIFLMTIGIAVTINLGTNCFFSNISFLTNSTAALLQFAISMDYAIFLLHRFTRERKADIDVEEAMKRAIVGSVRSVTSSALTTVAGFVAFLFMRYELGADLGLILAKGIVLSLISVFLLLPVLALYFDKLILRTQHRNLLPPFGGWGKWTVKLRYGAIIMLLLVVPVFLAQTSNSFQYGQEAVAANPGSPSAEDKIRIEETFGAYNPMMVLVPKGNVAKQAALADALESIPNVREVQALVKVADPALPQEMLPSVAVEQFESENYSRMVVVLNTAEESEEAFAAVDAIDAKVNEIYGDEGLVLGSSMSVSDIKTVVDKDYVTVTYVSIGAVLLILLLAFRSLSLPIILVFVIELSIWVNMSVPYFMGDPMNFIGYLIVSAIQLGATIDYAILLTDHYLDHRKRLSKKEAMVEAMKQAGPSIFTSCLILTIAGVLVGTVSQVQGVSQMGWLLGRGAFLSGLFVLILLPQLLVLLDKVVMKTTFRGKKNRIKAGKEHVG